MSWLTWGWVLQLSCGTVLSTALVSLLLTPAVKWLRNQLDPHTAGGLGDLPDVAGVPAHIRLAESEPSTKETP